MKNKGLLIALAVIGVIALLFAAVMALGLLWGRSWYGGGCCHGFSRWNNQSGFSRLNNQSGYGRGMMWDGSYTSVWPGDVSGTTLLSIEEAENAVNGYLDGLNFESDLHIKEVMVFDNHAYVMVVEEDTDIGAFELLVDPDTMNVIPEMGPNRMWNLKYGHMRGGMMGSGYNSWVKDMPISGEEALQIANEYLTSNNSDLVAEGHPDPFYGYYTIHTEKDGEVVGMLSVNGYNGEVFLHTWHGELIAISEHA